MKTEVETSILCVKKNEEELHTTNVSLRIFLRSLSHYSSPPSALSITKTGQQIILCLKIS
ncbi:CLUMA_CG010083, isoform A [Clunio marinus]|uniref:CLUMA_CG010083, isoform A n=1 Tax=Clunio marinus TaxID=568069 RepID=A0A1J1IAJ0_9DIPT|nr:CLUMA_CG010083, isoform A [Clunio marinus]